jgi:hypothetical protein
MPFYMSAGPFAGLFRPSRSAPDSLQRDEMKEGWLERAHNGSVWYIANWGRLRIRRKEGKFLLVSLCEK